MLVKARRAITRACVRACVCREYARDSVRSPGHDRLMQTYDVMRLDINIFPLIRQTPGSTSARAASLNGKTITLGSSARVHRGIVEIFHLVPSITRSPLHCTEKVTERSGRSRSTNREDPAVPRTHCIASHCIASRSVASRHIAEPESFYAVWSIVPPRIARESAFTERYANASPISHDEGRSSNVDNRRTYMWPHRVIFASRRQGVRSRDSWDDAMRRVVNLCEFTIPCLSLPGGCEVLSEIVNFATE